MEKYYIGVDVGGTNIRIGLVSNDLKIIHEEKYKSNLYADKLGNIIETFYDKFKNDYSIIAISAGFPGLVDQETAEVFFTPNERRFEGTYLQELSKKLNIPIIVGNDVNYLMLYDAKHFEIDPNKSVLGFYVGTGFGNAIRIKDKLYTGEFGQAGEIGHVPMYVNGIDFTGEKQSELEAVVSGFNLIDIHKKHFPNSPFETMFKDHFDSKEIQTFLHILAFYIATEITIFDISTIILGGGVIMSDQFPRTYLESLIKKNLFSPLTQKNFNVYYAESSINSGILGAVINAISYLNK